MRNKACMACRVARGERGSFGTTPHHAARCPALVGAVRRKKDRRVYFKRVVLFFCVSPSSFGGTCLWCGYYYYYHCYYYNYCTSARPLQFRDIYILYIYIYIYITWQETKPTTQCRPTLSHSSAILRYSIMSTHPRVLFPPSCMSFFLEKTQKKERHPWSPYEQAVHHVLVGD